MPFVATTLRYKDEVTDPSYFEELKDLPEADEVELSMMTKDRGQDDEGPGPQSIPRWLQGKNGGPDLTQDERRVAQVNEKMQKKPVAKRHDGGAESYCRILEANS